jgi:hypothetical protein
MFLILICRFVKVLYKIAFLSNTLDFPVMLDGKFSSYVLNRPETLDFNKICT